MRLFLDTSVLIAASASDKGASREIFRLASANNWILVASDVLLTHDKGDFGDLLGKEFYGLPVRTPGMFLTEERALGRLRQS